MLETKSFHIQELDCADEILVLKQQFAQSKGIYDLEFDLLNRRMIVKFSQEEISTDEILKGIKECGMKALLWEKKRSYHVAFPKNRLLFMLLSGCFLGLGLFFQLHIGDQIVHHLHFAGKHLQSPPYPVVMSYMLSILCGTWHILPKVLQAIKKWRADIHLLMVIAILGALGIYQYFEGATVAFLFSVALFLEHWSMERARNAIHKLMELSPQKATIMETESQFYQKDVDTVQIKEKFLVRPGEKIPLDGIILQGKTEVNQSPITGESMPISKEEGMEVFAGTFNTSGAIICEVTKKASDTTLSRMIQMIQESQVKRAETEQWVERFAKIYTPMMIVLALLIVLVPPLFFHGFWDLWIYRALIVLVIACPCSLVIATPISILAGITSAARNGVLIKGGKYLENLAHLQAIAIDKTGTLTQGSPALQKIICFASYTETHLLRIAVSLEQRSEHPLARAFESYLKNQQISHDQVTDFESDQGKGVSGIIGGISYWIGNDRFLQEKQLFSKEVQKAADALEKEGHTVVFIGNDQEVCGLFSFADTIKEEAKKIIEQLKQEKIQKIVMLTGDHENTAHSLAHQIGVDAYYSRLLPTDKIEIVEELLQQYGVVSMVGDGVNDAPAMAVSSFGIVMGAMGTDVAIETADIALMRDELEKLPWLLRHARKVLRVIKENIFFSLGIKCFILILAILGLSSLWMAIIADTGVTVLVVANALKILRIQK